MELWIRSQNKKQLAEITGIILEDNEIQNILKPKYILDSSSVKEDGNNWVENGIIYQKYNANAKIERLDTYVYEMPEV